MNDIDSGSNRTTSLRDIRSVEAVVRLGKVLPKLGAANGPSKRVSLVTSGPSGPSDKCIGSNGLALLGGLGKAWLCFGSVKYWSLANLAQQPTTAGQAPVTTM